MAHSTRRDLLVDWLKDAYSLEKALTQVLDNQARRAEKFPHVHTKFIGHLEATRRHAQLVKGCLERYGEDVSRVKSGLAQIFGELQSQAMTSRPENVVRDSIMSAAAEQLEIGTYVAIISLARELGDDETVRICKEILEDEE
jgi:ferritin-like metal-binding protein YciE